MPYLAATGPAYLSRYQLRNQQTLSARAVPANPSAKGWDLPGLLQLTGLGCTDCKGTCGNPWTMNNRGMGAFTIAGVTVDPSTWGPVEWGAVLISGYAVGSWVFGGVRKTQRAVRRIGSGRKAKQARIERAKKTLEKEGGGGAAIATGVLGLTLAGLVAYAAWYIYNDVTQGGTTSPAAQLGALLGNPAYLPAPSAGTPVGVTG